MSSGGARARSGPAPDPNALRHGDRADWTHLPAAGRQGPLPDWPLPRPTTRELAVWAEEWRRPQAVMWELNGQQREVAGYVRWLVKSEAKDAPIALGTLVRQLQESLGLSLPGLARNRWIIASEDATDKRPQVVGGTSTKERLSRGA